MYSFKNDYSEGAHPAILEALMRTNLEQEEGYGEDRYSLEAADLIRQRIARPDAAVHFLTGGTQVNMTAISSFLRPHEAAIAAKTGHINVHETGAIEATGHKVVVADSDGDGKLTPESIQQVLDAHPDEHMVKPKLVYISDTTEVGAIYTKSELERLKTFCDAHQLYLYLDGARLGSALTAEGNDLVLSDLPKLTDAFYIGGTKNGALIGEALVIVRDSLKEDFRYLIKQRGAMLAKGRVTGIQFLELLKGNLYFDLASHANRMADKLREGLTAQGFRFLTHSPSNQIFPVLPNALIDALLHQYAFLTWSKVDAQHTSVRLVTSWATREAAVDGFLVDVAENLKSSVR
ncbi:threonine aldolase family protein [Sporolactobacillus vineae]|uniref:threonine aldolase family protein n=1 Tax=Sporolactobacillus vineae TaxID=444463 RepID=UPI000287BABA|nr:aminotransferase class I/II-fold pyridoxal phosphate-dependent enzyme [Sporolactobacillus vineae]